MSHAPPDSILACEDTRSRASSRGEILFESLDPILLDGGASPGLCPVFKPVRMRLGVAQHSPVGSATGWLV